MPAAAVGVSSDTNRRYRRTMEDAHTIVFDFAGRPGDYFLAVYDGHAGRTAAQWCGENLHKLLEDRLRSPSAGATPIPALLDAVFCDAETAIRDVRGLQSGTTAAVAYLRNEDGRRVLYCANVGDARIVLGRGDSAVRLSYDHKCTDEFEAKRVVDAGGFVINERVNGILAVSRALGDVSMKATVVGRPFTAEIDLGDEDHTLLLACDGVFDVCSDADAVALARDVPDAQAASALVVETALARDSTDNLTAIVAKIGRA